MRTGNWTRGGAAAVLTLAAVLFAAPTAQAQDPAAFYKGRNVDLYIGYSVGGAYDLYARVIARHLGKHIPGNPTIVPKNMALIIGSEERSNDELSKTLATLRPYASMLVIASGDEYIEEMLSALRA